MSDETARAMYESAREKLRELLQQEESVKQQISHWAPIAEQLARLSGVELEKEIAERISQESAAGKELGLTEAIRWVFRQPILLPLSPTQVRDRLAEMGYDLTKYAHVMPPIHNTLKRMKDAGEIREEQILGGVVRGFVPATNPKS